MCSEAVPGSVPPELKHLWTEWMYIDEKWFSRFEHVSDLMIHCAMYQDLCRNSSRDMCMCS